MFQGFGFGYYKFGHFPFGHADFGEDSVIKSFPYIEDPTTGEINTALVTYLSIIKENFNKKKLEIDKISDQVDTNKIRSDILYYLGRTIGVELDNYEPEDFKKSLVNNAVLLYRIKGTDDSFRIRGKISGYDVDVVNIYRIDIDRHIKTTTDFILTQGSGGSSQTVAGTLYTFPLLKSSVKFRVDGVIEAEDDGLGFISQLMSSSYTINGTINYETGDYSVTFTPAPLSGVNISADTDTGVEDKLLATSIGGGILNINSSQNSPYPIYPTSVKVFDEGTLIAEDDGNGNLIQVAGGYAFSGTVGYGLGAMAMTFMPAPISGNKITVNYDKTLLAEFLNNHPDDVYEIPADSGFWYVTLHPSKVAGNLSEGCGYCLTSYIKLKFTVLKPITISTGTENFFDRLVRKIRDITPIHIRDLLYELQMVISVDESQNIAVSQTQEEIQWIVHSNFHRYDIIPADIMATDQAAYVTGSIELV